MPVNISESASGTFDPNWPLLCLQGLTDCRIAGRIAFALPYPDDALNVTRVQLRALLCCSAGRDCAPCLQVIITIQGNH